MVTKTVDTITAVRKRRREQDDERSRTVASLFGIASELISNARRLRFGQTSAMIALRFTEGFERAAIALKNSPDKLMVLTRAYDGIQAAQHGASVPHLDRELLTAAEMIGSQLMFELHAAPHADQLTSELSAMRDLPIREAVEDTSQGATMSDVEYRYTAESAEDLQRIPAEARFDVVDGLVRLVANPPLDKKSGENVHLHPVGDWDVLYSRVQDTVTVLRVLKRGERPR